MPSRGRWWLEEDVQGQLRLTTVQVERLNALYERGLPQRVAQRRKLAEMDRLLDRLVARGNADEAHLERLSEQVETLRAQINVRRTMMLFAMYRTLTREQRTTFSRLRQTDSVSGTQLAAAQDP